MEPSVPVEKPGRNLIRALIYEFLGSALTVYAYNFLFASYMMRGFAYFIGWIIAASVSGAHFNPATSLAVYLVEGKYTKQIGRLLLYWLFQLMGAFAGILLVYLIFKRPQLGFFLWPHVQNPEAVFWYFSPLGNIYYGKVVFLEILNTLTFIWVYLVIIYKPSLRTTDEIVKGIGLATALWICYFLSAGSGACLNPALGLAQTCYQIGFLNGADQNGNGFASLIWVYFPMPLFGGIFAAILFKMNVWMDNKALRQEAPPAPVIAPVAAAAPARAMA